MQHHLTICLAFVYSLLMAGFAEAQTTTFVEQNGLVVVEAESTDAAAGWQVLDSVYEDFTGSAWLLYDGTDLFNTPGRSVNTYRVAITTPGKYRFQWRSRIARGDSNTDSNDSWLRISGGSDFFAQKGSRILYPQGIGRTPNPEGSSGRGYFKIYQNTLGRWAWRAATNDNDPYEVFVQVDTVAELLIEIAARSKGHGIDRFVLYNEAISTATATDPALPESTRGTSSVQDASGEVLRKPYPNPADQTLFVTLPSSWTDAAATVEYAAYDEAGRRHRLPIGRPTANGAAELTVAELASGYYSLEATARGRSTKLGQFLKL